MNPKTFELKVTDEEVKYLRTFCERHVLRIKRESPDDKAAAKAATRAKTKLSTVMFLNRVEIKILKRLCEDYVMITRTTTLPEYDRRINEFPEAAVKYSPYIEKTEAELEAVEAILKKIKVLI